MYSFTTEYQRASLTILPTENYNLPFMGHKNLYLSSLLVTCHQSSRLYGVITGSRRASSIICLDFFKYSILCAFHVSHFVQPTGSNDGRPDRDAGLFFWVSGTFDISAFFCL